MLEPTIAGTGPRPQIAEDICAELRRATTMDQLRDVWVRRAGDVLELDEPFKSHCVNLKDQRKLSLK